MRSEQWIGLRVANWRSIAGLTQQELADRVGKSREYISMIENGHRPVTKRSLLYELAGAIGVSPTDLLGQPEEPRDRDELAIYSAVPALRGALDDELETVAPVELPRLTALVDQALAARMACDYETLAQLLPVVVADSRRFANGHKRTERDGLTLFVRASVCAALTIKPFGHVDLSARLTERAHLAAQLLSDPMSAAAAAFASAQTALASGTTGGRRRSLAVASAAADAIGDAPETDEARAWYGMHRLQAALTAASLDRGEEAAGHYAEAERVAQLTESDPWRMEFTPANVGVWRVNIALENGEPERAPEYARRVDRTSLRTRQRLAHLHIGTGRGLYLAGKPEAAVRQFLTADRVSKSELRSRPTVREIVGQMVRDSRTRGGSDQLRDLATRLNIDPIAPDGERV